MISLKGCHFRKDDVLPSKNFATEPVHVVCAIVTKRTMDEKKNPARGRVSYAARGELQEEECLPLRTYLRAYDVKSWTRHQREKGVVAQS